MSDKTLHVFDMDSTLIETPKMHDIVDVDENGQIKTDNENIKRFIEEGLKGYFLSLFFKEICFKKSDGLIIILDCETKAPLGTKQLDFIQDLTPKQVQDAGLKWAVKKTLLKSIGEKNGILYLEPFPGFYNEKETLGTMINPKIIPVYNAAKNKMILTGRNEKMREDVEENLKNLSIEIPNFGLHLYSAGKLSIPEYKEKVIQDSILENGWEEIHFYEDKQDWLEKVAAEVTEKFPEIKFHKHHITNMK